MNGAIDRWLLRAPRTRGRRRLICFPFAGGGAAPFLRLQPHLPDVEVAVVQLPGRGPRLLEPPIVSFDALIAALAEIVTVDDRPTAFLGHSLGGLIAFELCRQVRRRPDHLFVSASRPPDRWHTAPRLHELDDAALVAALRTYNGTPAEVLADPQLLELVPPAVRADFALIAGYRHRPGPPLDVPMTVLVGRADPHVTLDDAAAWRAHGAGAIRAFDGDHFFLHGATPAVARCVAAALAPDLVRNACDGALP